jgi:hypothetical protein
MKAQRRVEISLTILVVALVVLLVPASPQEQSTQAAAAMSPRTTQPRDGQHDFDFEIGTWRTHVRRLAVLLNGSTAWVECEGITNVRRVWDGRANLVELRAHCRSRDFAGLSRRLYNPQSHQWTLNFANRNEGVLGQPTVGEFKDGRGEFFDQESFKGRVVLVRFVISQLSPDSWSFEQAFSEDAGKTWEVNWIATDTRIKDESNKSN